MELVEEVEPGGHVGFPFGCDPGLAQHDFVEVLLVHLQGHLVDRRHVDRLDDRVGGHVAEEGDFAPGFGGHVMLGAQHEDVGLYTQLLELLDGVLRGLGLQLLCGGDVGDVGQVEAEAVLSQLPSELAYCLEEWQRLDVAHHAADLGDDEVKLAGAAELLDGALYLVGDVGHDLHRLAQVVAVALLVDDALVDASGGDVVGAGGLDVGEAFVMAQVEVGLVAVDGHIALPVLVGVERPRVDVDVWVKLLYRYAVTTRFQQAGQRR